MVGFEALLDGYRARAGAVGLLHQLGVVEMRDSNGFLRFVSRLRSGFSEDLKAVYF